MSTTTAPRDDPSILMPPPSTLPTTSPLDDARLTDDDIDSLIASLSPTSELDHLRSIEKTLRETQSRRKREDEENRAKIHALQTSLLDLRKQSTRQAAEWRSLAQHAETIEKLDNRNFDLAKKINEQESVLSTMQNEVLELKRVCDELDEVDVEDETEMDRDALCLRIFRSLGFLPSKGKEETDDEWNSILVRSDTRNTAIQFDIATLHLKQNEISPLILADQLWKAAE
ncbi:Kinetochore-Ndc80 subunit Spc24 [Kalmanozyma brasiliensis GHG001]|uniref:Kinetochore protein Spc24 n=1 Tax=Kalmanozyma brasiliensis (strain GHG001) TaxID=1365824 RepID=V5EGZ9_KALBG|nr:Kinetochore-Ndc80 subunit Spc24 [Kalmanozyma brasiliensis GHG001]EST09836.1 Kinetochore-Ndc80 subunit Spc24 [Kalmanozyma brasiliensis GHG001]